jgi:glutathione S-transferase
MVRNYVLQYVFPRGPDGKPDRATIEAALPEIRKVLAPIDRAIDGRDFVVGDSVTLADILLIPMVEYVKAMPEGKEAHVCLSQSAPRDGQTCAAAELRRGYPAARRLGQGLKSR